MAGRFDHLIAIEEPPPTTVEDRFGHLEPPEMMFLQVIQKD